MGGDQRRSSFSVLQGDGLCFSRILSRKSSAGQSSHIYYRPAEGVPFKWEMQPGTPKNQAKEEDKEDEEEEGEWIPFPPLSPPPQLNNKLLPLPKTCLDQPKNPNKFFRFLKRIKITDQLYDKAQSLSISRASCTGKELSFPDQSDGDHFISSLTNHSCSSSSRNHGTAESSTSSSTSDDGPFCCSPWNFTSIMEEGNRRVYYCRDHKTAFTMENDGSFLSKIILSRVSSPVDDRSSFRFYNHPAAESGSGELGIPFQWEMQPGRPIIDQYHHQEEVIPPPSPPPGLQSLVFPPLVPRQLTPARDSVKPNNNKTSTTKTSSRIIFFRKWIKTKKTKRTTLPPASITVSTRFGLGELSFKLDHDDGGDHREEEESLSSGHRRRRRDSSVSRSSSSASVSILRLNYSKEQLKLSTRRLGRRDSSFSGHSCFNFKPWT